MGNNSFIAPSTPLDRRHLGKYEVLCRLSTGGMSAIYLAHQAGLAGFNKLVVLKTILPDISGEEDFIGMFLEEARITAAFNHPHIAQVFELDTDDGQLFIAMEFVQGCTLVEMARACRQARKPIPLGFTLASTRDAALALYYAHNFTDARGRKQTVIHRDVAEKNIMVTYDGVTKLLDFGIAKALGRSGRTAVGIVKGTSGYMSPEQIRGEPLDARSDVFALGVVMHECLTGLRLFHGKTAKDGMMAALNEDVQPPSKWNTEVSKDIDAVVLKALQRERAKRFSTALEFGRAIEKAAPGLIWYPEQCGELVTSHFSDRRLETRRLLDSAELGSEPTGEERIQNVLAMMRAANSSPGNSTPTEPKADGPKAEAQRRPQVITAPHVAPSREADDSTRTGVLPENLRNILRASAEASSVPVPSAPKPPPKATESATGETSQPRQLNSDAASDRTIPLLPGELRSLRAQFAKKNAEQPPPAETAPIVRETKLPDAKGATERIPPVAIPRSSDSAVTEAGATTPRKNGSSELPKLTRNPEAITDSGTPPKIAKSPSSSEATRLPRPKERKPQREPLAMAEKSSAYEPLTQPDSDVHLRRTIMLIGGLALVVLAVGVALFNMFSWVMK